MIELLDFTQADFSTLRSWIDSEEDLVQFAGSIFSHPLTDEQLEAYTKRPELRALKVVWTETGETIGHCELNYENGPRLSRILIGNKSFRGRGLGKRLAHEMVSLLFDDPETREVHLHVFDWNVPAIKAYERIGFKVDPSEITTTQVDGEDWTKLRMNLSRTDWNPEL